MTDRPRRLAIVGMGKMGRAVAQLAPERGWELVACIDSRSNRDGRGITRERLGGAEVSIEFTTPGAAPANIRALIAAGCPVVTGTTGWLEVLPEISEFVERAGGALLTAANFSMGIAVFQRLVSLAATLLSGVPGFDVHLVETHHAAKKDAPSGTALALVAAAQGWGREIPITSVRTGSVPGSHEVIFDAPFETIRLEHHARDRRVFAEGALTAASWLVGRRGVFSMSDVIEQRERHGS